MFLILQILQDTSLLAIEAATNNLVYGAFGVTAIVAAGIGVAAAGTKL